MQINTLSIRLSIRQFTLKSLKVYGRLILKLIRVLCMRQIERRKEFDFCFSCQNGKPFLVWLAHKQLSASDKQAICLFYRIPQFEFEILGRARIRLK